MAPIRLLSAAAIFLCALLPTPAAGESTSGGLEQIPSFGIGTWLSDKDKTAHAIEFALKSGYNHIDSALIYRNEAETGRGIVNSGLDRKEIWVTSKLWNTAHRPEQATAAIRKTLSDLRLDYLDLYLVHWPVAFVPGAEGNRLDESVTLVDTWRALENLVRANLTRHIGLSNFDPAQVEDILDVCTICPYAHEFETHPYLQQQAFVDWHRARGVKVIAYSPLANTNPTYRGGDEVLSILHDPFWLELARRKNATVVQTILAWGLRRDTVVIPKSTSEEHIADNLGALDIDFTSDELEAIGRQDRKVRLNNPAKNWGVKLFDGLDDPDPLMAKQGGGEL